MTPTTKQGKKIGDKDLLNQIWNSWTRITNWFLDEEYNTKLAGESWCLVFDEMRRTDAQVNAVILAMELPIRSTRWFIKPAENADGETGDLEWEVADFIEDCLFNTMEQTWDDLLREILTMLPFWFSVFEKVYSVEDDKIKIKKLWFRKQTTVMKWETMEWTAWITQRIVSANAESQELWQVSIPSDKLLIFSYRREGDNYEWISVLRSAYKHWYIKDKLIKFDAVKHERLSIWFPVITIPAAANDQDKLEAKTIWMNVRANEQTCVVLPSPEWKFEFSDTRVWNWTDLMESINFHNREIAKNVLAHFMELWNTQSWSRSLGDSQTELFLQSLNSIWKQICDTFNRFVIPQVVDYNFNVDIYPKLAFDVIEQKDMEKFATTISTLIGAAAINPDEDLEDHLRDILQLPARMKDVAWNKGQDGQDSNNNGWTGKTPPAPQKPSDSWKQAPKDKASSDIKDQAAKMNECWCWSCVNHGEFSFDQEYFDLSKIINNKHIVKLQAEARDGENYASLKAKWFKFNDFEKEAFRPLTFAERKVNFTGLKRSLDSFESQLDESLDPLISQIKADLLEKVKKAVESNDIKALGEITASMTGDLAQVVTDIQKEMFEIWKKSAAVEMNVPVPSTKAEVKGAMRVQNDAVVGEIVSKLETQVKTAATWIIANHGWSIVTTNAPEVINAVSEVIDKVFDKGKNAMKTLSLIGSVNLGRSSIFERYPEKIYWFQFSAILDWKTTETCRSLDGRVIKPGSSDFYNFNPPLHYNCRSIMVEILMEETFKPAFTWIPPSITPPTWLDTFKDLKAPIILKSSPVVKVIQQEIEDKKTKIAELEQSWKYPNRLASYKQRVTELEKSLATAFHEFTREILTADGVIFK